MSGTPESGSRDSAHLRTPDEEARQIDDLRPTLAELTVLPQDLLEDSQRWLGRVRLWETEKYWYAHLLAAMPVEVPAYPVPECFALYLLPGWDVYTNMGTLEPWWRLGNLKTDGVDRVMVRYRAARPLGMRLALFASRAELAASQSARAGQRVYGSANDLMSRYIGQHAQAHFQAADPSEAPT